MSTSIFFFEIIYLYSYKIKSKHALIASQNNIGRIFFLNCTRQFVVKQVFAHINSARHKGSQMELKFSKRLQRKQTCNLVTAKDTTPSFPIEIPFQFQTMLHVLFKLNPSTLLYLRLRHARYPCEHESNLF